MNQRHPKIPLYMQKRFVFLTGLLVPLISLAIAHSRLAFAQSITESETVDSAHNQKLAPANSPNAKLLEKLQSDSYTTRQLALWNLESLGREALPIIKILLPKADANLTRELIRILSSMAAITSQSSSREAHDLLQRIATEGVTLRSQIARQALSALSTEKAHETIENLLLVGGVIEHSDLQILNSKSIDNKTYLIIDNNFEGTLKDLDGLQWLRELEIVRLVGPKISLDIIERIASLPNLKTLQIVNTDLAGDDLKPLLTAKRLEILEILYTPIDDADISVLSRLPVWQTIRLFGTKISNDGIEELRQLQPSIDFIYGRGGFLGISSREGCVVFNVTPNGAAYAAGIQEFDKITSINGIEVIEFAELRKELSKCAVGEEVVLQIERSNRPRAFRQIPQKSEIQRLTITAKLRQQPQ